MANSQSLALEEARFGSAKQTAKELVLKDCAWIADDGRFTAAVEKGEFSEVEPFPDGEVIVGRGAILDAYIVRFDLPRKQK